MYSETTQAHYRHPQNLGRLANPDAVGEASVRTPSDNWIQFHLAIHEARITQATFRAVGCAATIAAGSVLTEWAIGQTIAEAQAALTPTVVDALLDGLPASKAFCADLAVAALEQALGQAPREAPQP